MIPDHNLWHVVPDTGLEGVCTYNQNNKMKRKAGYYIPSVCGLSCSAAGGNSPRPISRGQV